MQGFKTSTGEGCIAMRAYTPNEQVCFVVLFLSLLHVHTAPKPPLFVYLFLSHGSVLFSKRWRSLFFWDAQPCKKHYWRLQMKAPLRVKVIAKTNLVSPIPFMSLLVIFISLGWELARAAGIHSAAHQICGWHKVAIHTLFLPLPLSLYAFPYCHASAALK